VDLHLHRPGEDVCDLFARMHVPARLDAGWDPGEHLDDVASRGSRMRCAAAPCAGASLRAPRWAWCRATWTDLLIHWVHR
jgi:hypothetical protein